MLYQRYRPLKTRLLQHPDQTGVLTVEQQNLNQRVLAVFNTFEATENIMLAAFYLLAVYNVPKTNLQQQVRDQIIPLLLDLLSDLGVRIEKLERKVRELEGLDVTDAQ